MSDMHGNKKSIVARGYLGGRYNVYIVEGEAFWCECVGHGTDIVRAYAHVLNIDYPHFYCREHFHKYFTIEPQSIEEYE